MNREQLHHAIRTACDLTGQSTVIIVGSQSILGSFSEDELPIASTRSMEVDVLPIASSHDEIARLADIVEGVAGEMSPYDDLHGFHLDGVDDTTAILPAGWRDRLVSVSGPGTRSVSTGDICTGLCLEPHDLCASKLCAHRTKDLEFVGALIASDMVNVSTIVARLRDVPEEHHSSVSAALGWLQALRAEN